MCFNLTRNHPNAVFMLYSRLSDAESAVQGRRDVAGGFIFTDERLRQAPSTQLHHDGEDLVTSALHGLIYQHIGGNVDIGRVLDEDNEWVRLDVERYISTLSKAHRKKIRHQRRLWSVPTVQV